MKQYRPIGNKILIKARVKQLSNKIIIPEIDVNGGRKLDEPRKQEFDLECLALGDKVTAPIKCGEKIIPFRHAGAAIQIIEKVKDEDGDYFIALMTEDMVWGVES